ncbi:MAG TPA: hypothetical protein VEV38_03985 [Candidatus Eremiobacteraceae bacterium]|nr:hypothetical protein [Candidatus Eremiobacteraceae bacterium]
MAAHPEFINFPAILDRSVYDRAVRSYVAAVGSRSSAIYHVGNVRFPGLSDIDLVVVVNTPAWDNNQFFSPYIRLGKQYTKLFHHEPRFLPETCIEAITYSSCVHASAGPAMDQIPTVFGSRRALIHGTDVLGDRAVDVTSESWQRCRLLETSFIFVRARQELASESAVDVIKLMSRATSLRYPMRHLHDLLRMSRDRGYEKHIDEARARLLAATTTDAEKRKIASDTYDLFDNGVRRFEANIRTLFGIGRDELLPAAVMAMLAGERPAPGVDDEYLDARRAATAFYHEQQRAYCLSAGSIFATKPLNGTRKPYVQPLAHRIFSGARWRLRPVIAL